MVRATTSARSTGARDARNTARALMFLVLQGIARYDRPPGRYVKKPLARSTGSYDNVVIHHDQKTTSRRQSWQKGRRKTSEAGGARQSGCVSRMVGETAPVLVDRLDHRSHCCFLLGRFLPRRGGVPVIRSMTHGSISHSPKTSRQVRASAPIRMNRHRVRPHRCGFCYSRRVFSLARCMPRSRGYSLPWFSAPPAS